MARAKKGTGLKHSGTTLGTRFSIQMSLALAVVTLGAGAYLYREVLAKAGDIQVNAFVEAVAIQGPLVKQVLEDQRLALTMAKPDTDHPAESAQPVQGAEVKAFSNGEIRAYEVMYGPKFEKPGYLYQYQDVIPPLIVSQSTKEKAGEGLLKLILGVTAAVILVGACVAYLVAKSVSRPLEMI